MTNAIKLNGSIRENLGSGASKRLRKEGLIPAVIYSDKGKNLNIAIKAREFNKEYLSGNIQIRPIEIQIDGKVYKVLTYKVEIHPVSDLPIHVDFLNVEGKKEVKVFVPVEFKGAEKAPGLKKGGFLNIITRKIQLWCDPTAIPAKISVNVSKLNMGNTVKAYEIKFPKEATPVDKKNFVVVSVTGRGKSMDIVETKPVEGVPVEGAPTAEGATAEAKPAEGKAEGKTAGKAEGGAEAKPVEKK